MVGQGQRSERSAPPLRGSGSSARSAEENIEQKVCWQGILYPQFTGSPLFRRFLFPGIWRKEDMITPQNGYFGAVLPEGSAHHTAVTHVDLAIVGGGFSGLCTVWHLLSNENVPATFRCAIIEPGARLGAGLAYRTDCPHHLLNVRARGMSITDGDTGSLVRWLAECAPEFSADDFIPRGVYRRYINDCLDRVQALRPAGMVTVLRDHVTAIDPQRSSCGYLVRLDSGSIIHARVVVLAVGNLPAKSSLDNGLLLSPWCGTNDYAALDSLAIIGSGLTALDVILEAEATGFSGSYRVISPHGQFPRPHRESFQPVPVELRQWAADLAAARPTLRQTLHAFQQQRNGGNHWQDLVDALRKHAPALWGGFDLADKRRFLRHLRTTWNIHLHRSCQRSIRIVTELRDCGRLHEVRALVTAVEPLTDRSERAVRLFLRSGVTESSLDVDGAVNATGLFSNIMKTDSQLMMQLLADGLVQPDAFCFGLRASGDGHLLAADGSLQPGFFTIGTLRRGEELECTAVPEIRRQVAVMTGELVRMLDGESTV
jgi:uncharacterized NAD(P)/FAD-binding protein YdhS